MTFYNRNQALKLNIILTFLIFLSLTFPLLSLLIFFLPLLFILSLSPQYFINILNQRLLARIKAGQSLGRAPPF